MTNANRGDEIYKRAFRVPVRELPSWAQEKAKRLVADYEERDARFPDQSATVVKKDHARLDVRTEMRWVIPGIGETGDYADGRDLIRIARGEFSFGAAPSVEIPANIAAAKDVKIPASLVSRALLVRLESKEEIEKAASAAKERGLNELWAEASADAPQLIEAAVAAGKAHSLKVFAVVRVLRPGKGVAATPDLNLLGETSAGGIGLFPAWLSSEMIWRTDWDRESEAARRRRLGDYLRCDLPATREALRPLLARIAKIPGLAGLVLRDVQPPGYDIAPKNWKNADSETLFQYLGFNEEMRLTFLRGYGVDPVDLSPLAGGRLGGYFGPIGYDPYSFDNALPFFPDYGPNAIYRSESDETERFLKVSGDPQGPFAVFAATHGARDRWGLWAKFRRETIAAFLTQLRGELKAFAPLVPVRLLIGPDAPKDTAVRWCSPLDAAKPPLLSGGEDERENADGAAKETPLPERLRRVSKPVALCLSYYPSHDADRGRDFARQAARQIENGGALKMWDGVVLDFSAASLPEMLSALTATAIKPSEDFMTKAPPKP